MHHTRVVPRGCSTLRCGRRSKRCREAALTHLRLVGKLLIVPDGMIVLPTHRVSWPAVVTSRLEAPNRLLEAIPETEVVHRLETSVPFPKPMAAVPSRRELAAHPSHSQVNVVCVVTTQLLAVVDGQTAREKRTSGRTAVPVSVVVQEHCADRGAVQSGGQMDSLVSVQCCKRHRWWPMGFACVTAIPQGTWPREIDGFIKLRTLCEK